jgi:hypothetical protein
MFRRLTGREPDAEGMAEFHALEAELKAEHGPPGGQVNDA